MGPEIFIMPTSVLSELAHTTMKVPDVSHDEALAFACE